MRHFQIPGLVALLAMAACVLPVRHDRPETAAAIEREAATFIRTNQVGYLPGGPKVAVACSMEQTEIGTFTVVSEEGAVVYGPEPAVRAPGLGPCAVTHRLDFTTLEAPGRYRVVAGDVESRPVRIAPDVYSGAADTLLMYLRQQRSGFNPLFGDSVHHETDAILVDHPRAGEFFSVAGGWHDAADYLQYVTTSATATYSLLAAFRDYPAAFSDGHGADGLPGANGVADVLDEARHGLEWLVAMFPEDGLLLNQIADDRDHRVWALPTTDSADYGWGPGGYRPVYPCTGEPQGLFEHENRSDGWASTAGKFASAMGLGARLLAERDPTFADTLTRKAVAAYELGREHPGVCQTAPAKAPYFYEEESWVDDMELAAAQLHALTGQARYLREALEYAREEPVTPWMGQDTARHYQWYPWHNYGHYEIWREGGAAARRLASDFYRDGLERVAARADNGFRVGIPFIWCSNDLMTSFATQARLYRRMTGDDAFRGHEQAAIDWILGTNPWGASMVIGYPADGNSTDAPHSVIAREMGAWTQTGGLVDGPVYRSIYENLLYIELDRPDRYARFNTGPVVYHDDFGDYSTNEPIMDGTANLVYVMAALAPPRPTPPRGPAPRGGGGPPPNAERQPGLPRRPPSPHLPPAQRPTTSTARTAIMRPAPRLTLLPLVALALVLTPGAAAAQAASAVEAADLVERVVVRRTAYGVPHIRAESLRAAAFAMGWVQVEDYGMDVVEGLVRARGEWSRYTGPESIDRDALSRRRYARAVETYHRLPADVRTVLEGFATGVNRYIELNPESFPDWVRPGFDGYDVHARSITGSEASGVRAFLERLDRLDRQSEETAQGAGAAGGTPGIWERLAATSPEPHPDVGSNAWALAPSRTESGHAILVRNPHLSWDAGYYEAHITVPGVIDFYGDFRLGGPFGIIGGFNRHLGWATTNNYPDLDEIYAFDVDPDRVDHYLLDEASVPIGRETVTVEFRNGPGLGAESREFLTTPFGPVVHRAGGKVYVLRTAYEGGYRRGEQFLRMMQATTLEEWKAAMRIRAHPSSNLTYADADGNIFYVWNATASVLPHRSGGDTAAVAVATTDGIGTRVVAWDSLPQLLNPVSGYLHNENDEFHYTNLDAVFDPGDFPDHYPEPRLRLRSQHSLQLIAGDDKLSLEEVVERKHSMRMLLADRVRDDLVAAVRAGGPTGEVADAIALIEAWDGTVARDSRGGVLFKTWWWRYVATGDSADATPASAGFEATAESLFAEVWSPERPISTPRGLADPDRAAAAFEWAVKEAEQRYGAWDRAWGDVHRARIGDVDVPVGGCTGALGCFRVLWFVPHEEDPHRLQARGGDGWVFAVELGETPRAYSILAYGQSDEPDNPHFNDQLALFADNRMKTVAFTEEDIRASTIREYRPGRR